MTIKRARGQPYGNSARGVDELLKQVRDALAGHGEALRERVEHKAVAGLARLDQRDFSLRISVLEHLLTGRIAHAIDEPVSRLERLPDVGDPLEEEARVLCAAGTWRDPVRSVAARARLFESFRRQQLSGDGAMTRHTGRSSLVAVIQELEVPALLKRDERPRVAGAAGPRKIRPVNGARGIETVEHILVSQERLERARVSAMTAFAAHVVSAVQRPVPGVQVVWRRRVRTGEMTIRAPALGQLCRRVSCGPAQGYRENYMSALAKPT